jgi:ABC-type sugar transport system substrate-binding protein
LEDGVGVRENGVVGVGTPARLRSRGEFLRLAGGAGIGAAIVPIFATACVPPGGRLDQRALAKVGPKGQQEWEASKQAGSCDVEPPNVGFEAATFGFAQSENNNPWRIAQTASMRTAATARGVELIITDAQSSTPKQVSDIQDMIAQGVDLLFVPPREEEGMAPALESAAEANVPVFFVDREANARICKQYVTFMGSDFVRQGERAAEWLAKATDGKAKIVELEGTLGASVTADRGEGFREGIKKHAGMKIIASQTGNFTRADGQTVTEQIIGAYPDLTALYAHNDEMAIGAIQALKDGGFTPGKDVTVVSVDGEGDALQAIIRGELGATVETNPRFGPLAFDTARKFLSGQPVPKRIFVKDHLFDKSNAKKFVSSAY